MKFKLRFAIVTTLVMLTCQAQQLQASLPKIEDYTKGELEIKVVPFGLDNPISVGEIASDGTIHFNWNNDISSIKDPEFFMSSIKNAVGMTFCNEKEIEKNNMEAKSVEAKELFLYKSGQQVGVLFPATQKEIEDNISLNRHTSLVLGSTLSWFYSDSDAEFKAKCTVNLEYENSYDFKEITTYNIQLEKGWNLILETLVEKEDWQKDSKKGSLPKTVTKTSITTLPNTMNWYVKYWGN